MVVLPKDPAYAMDEGIWDTGYALASAYFPGLPREDFYAYAADYLLAMSEWDDIVGDGVVEREPYDRFAGEGFGLIFNLLRHPRPEGIWSDDDDRGNIVARSLKMVGVRSLLDFGGGVASHAISLARRGYQLGYVDIGETALFGRWRVLHEGFATAPAAREPGKVACYEDLAEALGFRWSAICALDVLEHCWEPVELIQTFHDALPVGGLLIITRHSFKEHPTHLERTFWLFDQIDKVLADMGFRPLVQPDPHYGIGSWRKV